MKRSNTYDEDEWMDGDDSGQYNLSNDMDEYLEQMQEFPDLNNPDANLDLLDFFEDDDDDGKDAEEDEDDSDEDSDQEQLLLHQNLSPTSRPLRMTDLGFRLSQMAKGKMKSTDQLIFDSLVTPQTSGTTEKESSVFAAAEEELMGTDILLERHVAGIRRHRPGKRGRPKKVDHGYGKSTTQDLPPHISKLMGQANTAYVQQDFDRAVHQLSEVIRQAPYVIEAYMTLGMVYEEQAKDLLNKPNAVTSSLLNSTDENPPIKKYTEEALRGAEKLLDRALKIYTIAGHMSSKHGDSEIHQRQVCLCLQLLHVAYLLKDQSTEIQSRRHHTSMTLIDERRRVLILNLGRLCRRCPTDTDLLWTRLQFLVEDGDGRRAIASMRRWLIAHMTDAAPFAFDRAYCLARRLDLASSASSYFASTIVDAMTQADATGDVATLLAILPSESVLSFVVFLLLQHQLYENILDLLNAYASLARNCNLTVFNSNDLSTSSAAAVMTSQLTRWMSMTAEQRSITALNSLPIDLRLSVAIAMLSLQDERLSLSLAGVDPLAQFIGVFDQKELEQCNLLLALHYIRMLIATPGTSNSISSAVDMLQCIVLILSTRRAADVGTSEIELEAAVLLGGAYAQNAEMPEEIDRAINTLEMVLSVAPNRGDVRRVLALLYRQQGKSEKASFIVSSSSTDQPIDWNPAHVTACFESPENEGNIIPKDGCLVSDLFDGLFDWSQSWIVRQALLADLWKLSTGSSQQVITPAVEFRRIVRRPLGRASDSFFASRSVPDFSNDWKSIVLFAKTLNCGLNLAFSNQLETDHELDQDHELPLDVCCASIEDALDRARGLIDEMMRNPVLMNSKNCNLALLNNLNRHQWFVLVQVYIHLELNSESFTGILGLHRLHRTLRRICTTTRRVQPFAPNHMIYLQLVQLALSLRVHHLSGDMDLLFQSCIWVITNLPGHLLTSQLIHHLLQIVDPAHLKYSPFFRAILRRIRVPTASQSNWTLASTTMCYNLVCIFLQIKRFDSVISIGHRMIRQFDNQQLVDSWEIGDLHKIYIAVASAHLSESTKRTKYATAQEHRMKAIYLLKRLPSGPWRQFNLGRALHFLGLHHMALEQYRLVLASDNAELVRSAAFNMHLIYLLLNNHRASRAILSSFVVF